MQRLLCIGLGMAALWSGAALRGDEVAKPDYKEFSKIIHKMIASQAPKEYRDESTWGQAIPLENLKLMGLRTVVQVDGKPMLPHGTWRKTRVWLADAERDVTVRVRDFQNKGDDTLRLAFDIEAALQTASEAQQWQKGLRLIGAQVRADIVAFAQIECDLTADLDITKQPPELKVLPKVTALKLSLKDLNLREVKIPTLGNGLLVVEGAQARELGNLHRETLNELLRTAEPVIRAQVNGVIVRSIQEGKGPFSAAALFKALPRKAK